MDKNKCPFGKQMSPRQRSLSFNPSQVQNKDLDSFLQLISSH